MHELTVMLSWGSPLGIGLLFFLSGIGAGIFFWGLAQVNRFKNEKK
jgi:choline-glycine betaine transporter